MLAGNLVIIRKTSEDLKNNLRKSMKNILIQKAIQKSSWKRKRNTKHMVANNIKTFLNIKQKNKRSIEEKYNKTLKNKNTSLIKIN